MITRVRMTDDEKRASLMAEWSREVNAARSTGRTSERIQQLERQLDLYWSSQPDWDADELAELATRAA